MDHGSTKKRCGQIVTLIADHILQERDGLLTLPNEQFYRNFFSSTYNKTQAPTITPYMRITLLPDQF